MISAVFAIYSLNQPCIWMILTFPKASLSKQCPIYFIAKQSTEYGWEGFCARMYASLSKQPGEIDRTLNMHIFGYHLTLANQTDCLNMATN